jgi:hypothetical protein
MSEARVQLDQLTRKAAFAVVKAQKADVRTLRDYLGVGVAGAQALQRALAAVGVLELRADEKHKVLVASDAHLYDLLGEEVPKGKSSELKPVPKTGKSKAVVDEDAPMFLGMDELPRRTTKMGPGLL